MLICCMFGVYRCLSSNVLKWSEDGSRFFRFSANILHKLQQFKDVEMYESGFFTQSWCCSFNCPCFGISSLVEQGEHKKTARIQNFPKYIKLWQSDRLMYHNSLSLHINRTWYATYATSSCYLLLFGPCVEYILEIHISHYYDY